MLENQDVMPSLQRDLRFIAHLSEASASGICTSIPKNAHDLNMHRGTLTRISWKSADSIKTARAALKCLSLKKKKKKKKNRKKEDDG
jgi:hypothetical protein